MTYRNRIGRLHGRLWSIDFKTSIDFELFAAWRVGYQLSKQLNLKRRVPNCGRYRCDSAAPHSKRRNPMDNMLLIIIVLLLLFGGGGYWARGRYW